MKWLWHQVPFQIFPQWEKQRINAWSTDGGWDENLKKKKKAKTATTEKGQAREHVREMWTNTKKPGQPASVRTYRS